MTLDELMTKSQVRVGEESIPPDAQRDAPSPWGSRHVVIVENEDGLVEYKVLHADGHLGAVED